MFSFMWKWQNKRKSVCKRLKQISFFRVSWVPEQYTGNFNLKKSNAWMNMRNKMWANQIFPSNLPDFSLGKYPVQPGKIPIVWAIRHNHRQWLKRFIWWWMCPWPRPTWIMHLFSGVATLQPTVVSLCSCVQGKRICSVELRAASNPWPRQKRQGLGTH